MYTLDEIESSPISRLQTGHKYLDPIFGKSIINGREQFGLPYGKITLIASAPGVGKTRFATDLAITMNANGLRVLVFQNEVTPSEYKGWIKRSVKFPKSFFVANYSNLQDQIDAIKKCKPSIVICDSVNMIDDYDSSKEIRKIMEDYKQTAQDIGCHVMFIGHLNKKDEVKGNNDLEYLIDINCKLTPYTGEGANSSIQNSLKSMFVLEVGKNRYGTSGGWCCFKHVETGIEYVCGSEDPRIKNLAR